jgi:AcrR family transcriptional regulator
MSSESSRHKPYHHGNLRVALVEAAVALAEEGGPEAVTLREATRRVGVSPNAAYRHFADVGDLLGAVRIEALAGLTAALRAELSTLGETGEPDRDAMARLRVLGNGYVRFALTQPGLFATAFSNPRTGGPAPPFRPQTEDLVRASTEPVESPLGILQGVIEDMERAGCLRGSDVGTATVIAWAGTHGLAELLLASLATTPASARDHLVDATMTAIISGLSIPVAQALVAPGTGFTMGSASRAGRTRTASRAGR